MEPDPARPLLYARLFAGQPPPLRAEQRARLRSIADDYFAWDAGQAVPVLERGARVGRWQVERVLGAGGQSVVYRVRHVQNPARRAALKVPHGELAARLVAEASVLRRLDHEGIVRLLKAPQTEPPCLLLEYCAGGSLAERLESEGPLPEPLVMRVALDVLAALEHAHQNWILHGDLKPSNILFSSSGVVKIADFGLGTLVAERDTTGSLRGCMGTPLYLAPEQEHPLGRVDERSDLYAFGKLLYAMLTARSPRTLRPVERVRPELHPGWSDIIFRLTEEEPRARYPDARAVRRALTGLATRRGWQDGPLEPWQEAEPEPEPAAEREDMAEAAPPTSTVAARSPRARRGLGLLASLGVCACLGGLLAPPALAWWLAAAVVGAAWVNQS